MTKNSLNATAAKTATLTVGVETPTSQEEPKPEVMLCMCGEPWEPEDLGWGDGWLRCPYCYCL